MDYKKLLSFVFFLFSKFRNYIIIVVIKLDILLAFFCFIWTLGLNSWEHDFVAFVLLGIPLILMDFFFKSQHMFFKSTL